jgi:perosamine synthetase
MIPVNTPLLSGNEKKYLNECIDSGWISSEGPFVQRFEKEFAAYVDRKFGIAVANGSAALDIAIQALDLKAGDEVIMPSFTIISPAASIVRQGARPVLVDSLPDTWNMDVSAIEQRITARTKAILVVHIYGLPVDMDPVMALASKYRLMVIEDAAEMHGQTYRGKKCGSFGVVSVFSFYPNKLITTGEGGMLVTDDPVLAKRCHSLKNLCFLPEKRFIHEELGWNYRMTNLQAALGVAQLENIGKHLARKREIGKRYGQLLSGISGFDHQARQTSFAENVFWVYGLVVNKRSSVSKDEIVTKLSEKKIGTRPFFYPMHLQPVFRKMGFFSGERYPVSENLYDNGFYIPSGLGITDDEIGKVADALHQIMS